jgi:PAS domain S-box-containing protein
VRQPLEVPESLEPAQRAGYGRTFHDHPVFVGGGEMGALMRSFDWSKSPLGPPESWTPALQNTARLLLANSFPMLLWWGPDFISLYNDAYRPVLGDKHPHAALGRPFRECWSEVFPILEPLVQTPFEGGPATWVEDIPLEVNRYGFVEETHFTIGYSAVPDPDAPRGIGGVLATVHEITQKVLGDRRLAALRELGTRSFDARTVQGAWDVAISTLAHCPLDIPFALIYLIDESGETARLAGETGVSGFPALRPQSVDLLSETGDLWQLAASRRQNGIVVVDDLTTRAGRLPQGPGSNRPSDPPHTAVILPIQSSLAGQPAGFLVAGISPRLRFDDAYRGFLELFSAQIATVVTNARAYEEERRRSEALAEIDRARTVFFSNVSHEFRTPLTLMMGPIEEALRQQGDPLPVRRESLELAHRNSLRLLKLVNTLLDFSRIEAGRIQAVYEPVDLAALTAELASVFRSAVERAGLNYTVDCPPLDQPVYIDREIWEKVVLNLLSNAFKFTLHGSIQVGLHAAGPEVQLIVRDTGTGIASADLPHVFERFYRVANSRGRSYEGSGIGLALVQELVRLSGGQIRVESQVDRGSAFVVTIPFGSAHLPQERIGATRTASSSIGADAFLEEASRWTDPAQEHPSAAPAPASAALARIVVADDNSDMREYVQHLLAGTYQVVVAADGQAALEAMLLDPPDLVLTDVMMPRLDGVGLLKAMRADKRTASIPVIMLSARAGEESRVEGVTAGADDYLVKPFSARELLARVENLLTLSRLRRDTERRVRESEERFRSLAAATFYSVYRMSPDWSELRQLTGDGSLAPTESPNRNWLQEYILPEDEPQMLRAIGDAIRTRRMFALEHRVRRADGSIGWTLSRAIPLFDNRGEITEWFGAAIDLTERRMHQENRARLAAIVDSADDAIISKDLNGIIHTWNHGAERMFGYTAAEAVGRSILTLIPPELQHEEDEILARLKAGQRIDHYETVRIRKSGERFEVSITVSPLRDESGRVTGASKIARDISDRRRIERLLMQSEKLSATGRMAASIAHEINNPLESLMNLIYLARHSAEPGSQAHGYLRTAEEELERVSHLARQTLGYYRDTNAPTEVRLHELIRNVLTVYNSRLIAAGISVDLRFNDQQRIMASKGELLQVFSNVIANALDAMSRGGTLHIATRKVVSLGGDGLEVVIRDTGAGIRPENLPRIFDPFFTTKGELGTGIGLWVAKQLIETRGGQISVASSVEPKRRGTTITILIPFAMPGHRYAA